MRISSEEPTGMRVRDTQGREVILTFPEFADAVAQGVILPDDHVCSHIVTRDLWVRVGDMRLYREIMQNVARQTKAREGVWPPAPLTMERRSDL